MLIKHTLIYSFGRLIPSAVNFLAIMVYTRLVMPETYGTYSLALSSAAGGSLALFYWLRQSIVRFLPEQRTAEDRIRFISTYLIMLGFQIGVIALLGLAIAFLMTTAAEYEFVLLITLLLCAQAWCETSTEILRADLKPQQYSRTYMIRSLLVPLLVIGAITAGYGAKGMIIGAAISWLLMPLQHLRGYLQEARMQIDWSWIKPFLRYGMPMTVSSLLYVFTVISDRWLITHFMGAAAVGLYVVGVDLARQSLWVLMHTISLAGMPLALKKMQEESEDAARQQVSHNLDLLLLIALPGMAGLALLAPNIAHVMLGDVYQKPAAALLPIIAFAVFLFGVRQFFFDQAFQLHRDTMLQIPLEFIVCATGIISNIILIPEYGIMGGGYAMVITAAVGIILSGIWGRRFFRLKADFGNAARTLLATLVMVMALWPLRHEIGVLKLGIQIMVGAATYAAAGWILNAGNMRTLYRQRLA